MTAREINKFKTDAVIALGEQRLHDTIAMLGALPAAVLTPAMRTELNALSDHYKYLLRYFAEGADDPQRDASRSDIATQLRKLVDMSVRNMQKADTNSQYYSLVRTFAMDTARTTASVLEHYLDVAAKLYSSFDMSGLDSSTDTLHREAEALEHELFERIWVEFPISKSTVEALQPLLEPGSRLSRSLRLRLINALGLGLLEFFDDRRFGLLADALDYAETDAEACTAMVWLQIALFRYRMRALPSTTVARLQAAREHPLWHARMTAVYLEMIRARDTERVTRRMQDDLMPDIMRVSRDLLDEQTRAQLLGDEMDAAEINPEWEDKLRESGAYEAMRELSEITGEGYDVFMGAFSHLKNFAFFSRIDAWFTPFDDSQPDVSVALAGEMAGFVDMLCRMPMPCDNDKFSMLFSINGMPADKRDAISAQINANSEAMRQAMESTEAGGLSLSARACVQNLYRFFKLYGRKNEFFDPFARHFVLEPGQTGVDAARRAAEMLFSGEAWDDAARLFAAIIDRSEGNDSALYQKAGYCYEQLGEYIKAAEYYQMADLIDGTSNWTLRRLAAVWRRAGQPDKAIEPLRRLCRLQPDSDSALLNLAFSLIENREYAEAMDILHRLDDIGGDTRRLWRAMAWTAFMTDDLDTARKYYELIKSDTPTAQDYLNMGHLAWTERRMRDAITFYGKSMREAGQTPEQLRETISADFRTFASKGVNRSDLPLIIDAIVR